MRTLFPVRRVGKLRWLVCLLVVAGCGSGAELDGTASQMSSPIVLDVVDPDTHLDRRLGEGYDSVTGKTKARCIDFSTTPTGTPMACSEMRGSEAQQRIRTTLGVGAGVQAGYGPASAGLSGDLDKSLEESESVTALAYVVDATLPSRSLDKVQLNETGRTARAANRWREVCGDEAVYQEKRGSLFSAVLRIEYTSREAKLELETGAKVSLAGSLGEVSARLRGATASVLSKLTVTVSVYQFGGSVQNLGKALGNHGRKQQGSSSAAAMLECGASNMKACHQLIESALRYASSDAAGFSKIGTIDPDPHVATLSFVTTPYSFLDLGLPLEKSLQEQMDDFVRSAQAKGELSSEAAGGSTLDLPRLGWREWRPFNMPKYQHYALRGPVCGTVFAVPGAPPFYLPVGPLRSKYMDLITHPLSMALGYPRGPVKRASDGQGQTLYFEHGAMYAQGDTVSVLQGRIFNRYETLGALGGELGYPLSSLQRIEEGHEWCDFEQGTIYWRVVQEHATHLTGILHALWKQTGGVGSYLGFPTGSIERTESGERVRFEHGLLRALPTGDVMLKWEDEEEESPFHGWYLNLASRHIHICGLTTDGSAQCWGNNNFGAAPASKAGPYRQLAAGEHYTCGLKTDGSVECWGANECRQAPKSKTGPYRQLTAGGHHTCGLKTDGSAECWGGCNSFNEAPPNQVGPYRQLSAGGHHTCGLEADGSAECWGNNEFGQAPPNKVGPYCQLTAGSKHTCGLKADGSAECWGSNEFGQAGSFLAIFNRAGPYRQLTAGSQHTCGLKTDGSAECWGSNEEGQAPPNKVGPYRQLTAGWRHTCGLKLNGSAECWGKIKGVFTARE